MGLDISSANVQGAGEEMFHPQTTRTTSEKGFPTRKPTAGTGVARGVGGTAISHPTDRYMKWSAFRRPAWHCRLSD